MTFFSSLAAFARGSFSLLNRQKGRLALALGFACIVLLISLPTMETDYGVGIVSSYQVGASFLLRFVMILGLQVFFVQEAVLRGYASQPKPRAVALCFLWSLALALLAYFVPLATGPVGAFLTGLCVEPSQAGTYPLLIVFSLGLYAVVFTLLAAPLALFPCFVLTGQARPLQESLRFFRREGRGAAFVFLMLCFLAERVAVFALHGNEVPTQIRNVLIGFWEIGDSTAYAWFAATLLRFVVAAFFAVFWGFACVSLYENRKATALPPEGEAA